MFDGWSWDNLVSNLLDIIFAFIMFPIQVIMYPVDLLLDQIPGIEVIPDSIFAIVGFIGSLPQTLVSLMGLSPFIWNALFVVFVLHLGLSPAINAIKRVWAFIRP